MAFAKLEERETNSYFIGNSKSFTPLIDLSDELKTVFDFAYAMTFGSEGVHRDHRTGGQVNRKNGEIFINAFQGKLAEFGLYKYFSDNGFSSPKPDLGLWKKGVWDDVDLEINNYKINVKSVAFFSNLLLLETHDWNSHGNYLPNMDKSKSEYDFFILTRIKPDGKFLIKTKKLFYSNEVDKAVLERIILSEKWVMDIAGFIKLNDLKYLIKEKFILPQNSLLNGKIPMDAENYYCQAGDMQSIELLVKDLRLGEIL